MTAPGPPPPLPPQPQPEKKKMGTGKKILIAVGVLGVLMLGGCVGMIALIANAANEVESDIEKRDAEIMAEVSLDSCEANDSTDWVHASGTVTNGSSKRSNYSIEITVTDGEGIQYAEIFSSIQNLDPGKTADWDGSGVEDWRPGTTCELVDVTRFASS